MLVLASIPSDKAYLLKFVLPNINFRGEGDQVFSPEGSSLEGYSLTVKQSQAGFSLSSPGGLATVLLEIGLITSSKAESLQKRICVPSAKTPHSRRRSNNCPRSFPRAGSR